MNEVIDEILDGEPIFRIRDKNTGDIVLDNLTIEMITPVIQQATPLNKVLFDSIRTDINSRLLIENKASSSEITTGTNNTKYITPYGLENANPSNLSLTKRLSIKTGIINDGGTIPQTSGFTNYIYFVSLNEGFVRAYTKNSVASGEYINVVSATKCTVNQSTRKVVSQIGVGVNGGGTSGDQADIKYESIPANYIEIAWK